MTHHAVLYLLYLFGFFHKGLPALIQTQHTVMVSVGNEACLNCRLVQYKDVLQVTWQKLSPEGERNVATFNKYYGQRVNADFRDKVEFKDAGLQNCSIVFRKVTEQDEGCYRCMFNTYPEGALKVSTCLRLYELHEPVLHVESNSAEEAVVSCSATGRPAPTVTLRVLQQDLHLSNYSSVSVTNTNSTVTVTSTAVLSGFHDDRTQVGCAVRVLSGPQKEVLMMIPEVKQSSADALKSDDGDHYFTWIIVLFVVLACGCAVAVITVLLLRKPWKSSSHKDSEATKTPQKPTEHPHEPKTPLMQHENENLRQRMSTGKHHKGNSPKTLSPSVKCQLFPTNESI